MPQTKTLISKIINKHKTNYHLVFKWNKKNSNNLKIKCFAKTIFDVAQIIPFEFVLRENGCGCDYVQVKVLTIYMPSSRVSKMG